MTIVCPICGRVIDGGGAFRMTGIPVVDAALIASLTSLHLIDEHWPLIERIHATTGDEPARNQLVAELYVELRGGAN